MLQRESTRHTALTWSGYIIKDKKNHKHATQSSSGAGFGYHGTLHSMVNQKIQYWLVEDVFWVHCLGTDGTGVLAPPFGPRPARNKCVAVHLP